MKEILLFLFSVRDSGARRGSAAPRRIAIRLRPATRDYAGHVSLPGCAEAELPGMEERYTGGNLAIRLRQGEHRYQWEYVSNMPGRFNRGAV